VRSTLLLVTLVVTLFGQTPPVPTTASAGTKPITLDEAIQEALAKNLDLAAERYNISVAEAREITARLRPNPVLSISGQTLDLLGASFNPSSPLGPNQLNIHTDFPFERGHKREYRVALAKADLSVTELGVREMMRKVIYDVQTAFVDVQQAKENLRLAQDNLRSLENVAAINDARLGSGDLAQVEVDRSRLAALQSAATVRQLRLQLEQAKIQLQLLIGRTQRRDDFDVSGALRREVVPESQAELLRLALTRRPDYLAAQQSQARSRADLQLQIANGKVDFSAGTEYTYQSAYGVSGSTLGLYFSAPLPVFNRNQGEIARAQREIVQAGARTVALQASIAADVEKAYRQYSVSKQLLESVESQMLAKATSVRDTTEYSYKRGEASLIEYLDAQRAFNDAMQTFNDARANYARSLYLLDSASGASVAGVN
jgi:cobalt-zinc-cadmium efflux system outer membrane protein